MIGLVMAGGKGSRMNLSEEKLLLKYKKPIVLHVVDALKNSECFSQIVAATSQNSPKTKKLLEENGIKVFETLGNGYVEDLNVVLQSFDDYVLVVSGDLPFLDEQIIKQIANQKSDNVWLSFLVTKEFLDSYNIKPQYTTRFEGKKCAFTGISFVNAKKISSLDTVKENYVILDDKRIAFNLNTKDDLSILSSL
ncbi:MAG: NTP transferase domain-containing protein [Nitrosopumilaceae archaeon]